MIHPQAWVTPVQINTRHHIAAYATRGDGLANADNLKPRFLCGIKTMTEQATQRAARLIREARHAIALTGAGISTPSGIPDFRSPSSGLWEKVDPFEIASIFGFKRHPAAFYTWIRPLAKLLLDAQPNPAHLALARLEQAGYLKGLITQNIDMLHTRAGSQEIYEVHGNLRAATCIECYRQYDAGPIIARFLENGEIPRCPDCEGVLKPNVVLFGEQLPVQTFLAAQQAAQQCDLLLVAGSSLEVAPVSDFPMQAKRHGAQLIIINHQPTYIDEMATVVMRDDVAEALPRIADVVLGEAQV